MGLQALLCKLVKKLGIEKFNQYVKILNYGNQDTSGGKGQNNGLTHCWLSSSLAISPREQLAFISKLAANKLPVSIDAQEKTKAILFQETLPNGWSLYGRTGSGFNLDEQGNKIRSRQIGWFVGFVTKDKRVLTFVSLISDETKENTYASIRAKAALKKEIIKLLDHT